MRPGDPGRCTAWETGFGVVEIGEPAADDGDAPVFGDRKDTMREALRWRGKALAVFHGHGIFLHFAASSPDRAWAIVDHYVPGLNCRHWFHVVELRADGTHDLSPPFGECGLDGVEVARDGDDLRITLDGYALRNGEEASATYAWHDGKIELLAQVGVEDREPPTPPMPVTTEGIGPVHLGMSIDEARRALPGARFERGSDGEGVAWVNVMRDDEALMSLHAGEDDYEAPIDANARIEHIQTFSAAAQTPEGVAVGWTVDDAARKYGGVREIVRSEIESREFVRFRNQPPHLEFRIDYCGDYPEGESRTTRAMPGCRVYAISVSRPDPAD